MTIPRVLLAAALLIVAFMLLGVQKNILMMNESLKAGGGQLIEHMTHISSQLSSAHAKLDTVIVRQRGTGRIGKPRVKPVPHLMPTPLQPPPSVPFPTSWFKIPPPLA
jgi:hypothetical protein